MVDIIIPCYKSKDKLYASLFSIGVKEPVHVILVDDASGDHYEDIINMFKPFFPIDVIYMSENRGPGVARNIGLEAAINDYVIFLDCGDVFASPFSIFRMMRIAKENPWAQMISFPHLDERDNFELECVVPVNNRIHGKLFKRTLLDMYNIKFNEECARINEDIGFCQSLRFINSEVLKTTEQGFILQIEDEATVIWCHHPDSLVRKNDFEYFYTKQNIGLAYNSLYAISNARKWHVSDEFINPIICEHMAFMYVMYICTKNDHPEFNDIAWAGAQYYYDNIYQDLSLIDPEQVIFSTQRVISEAYADVTNPFNNKIIDYTYFQFLHDLEEQRVNGENERYKQILLDNITCN